MKVQLEDLEKVHQQDWVKTWKLERYRMKLDLKAEWVMELELELELELDLESWNRS